MDAMSASVSELNRRCWLQVWNASGVILMTVFPGIVLKAGISLLSQDQVYLRCDRNATFSRHFLAHLSDILGLVHFRGELPVCFAVYQDMVI